MTSKSLVSVFTCSVVLSLLSTASHSTKAAAFSLVNSITIPGNATDLASGQGVNTNRLGGFGSDLYYDRSQNVFYGLADRGPGGGVISYNTRVQKFSLDVNSNTGAISNFKLLNTILFTKNGQNFNGLNPSLLNGNSSVLGLSHDPEGFAVAPNGNYYVSDEYGPSVQEFKPDGTFVRAFTTPANLIPKTAGNTTDYVSGRPTITSGRQDNRGFEGVTITPDGKTLYAMLQDPLVNEGSSNDGRRSQNLRIVAFDTQTGQSTGQYIYPLESLTDINNRIPGTANDFSATSQGRNIGISAITAINDKEFIVLERDNRGVGVDDPTGQNPVGSKRAYRIDLTGATDVSSISLAGTNTLAAGVTPVTKSSYFDLAQLLKGAGYPVPEKIEGLTIGPKLNDGSYLVLVATDNDFSVTQNSTNQQFDVCSDGTQIALDGACPNGTSLIPSYLFAFKASATDLQGYVPPETTAAVPEPATTVGLALAGLGSLWMKRRKS